MNINKWYWFFETIKQLCFNIFCSKKQLRQWMISEDRLERYQNMEKEYKLALAETNLYRSMYQLQKIKYEEVLLWLKENGGKINNYEK